MNLSVKGKGKR